MNKTRWLAIIILGIAGLLGACAGCGHGKPKKPTPLVPIIFLHCDLQRQPDGALGCECLHPLKVEKMDAQTGKRMIYAYCDGKVN